MDYTEAMKACEAYAEGGFEDWKLPNGYQKYRELILSL